MAQSPAEATADRDEPETTEPAAPPRKRPGFPWLILSLLSKIQLPSLGSERHEMITDAPKVASSQPGEPSPAATKKRAAARIPLLSLKRETRVGLAVVLTFVVFVGALVVKKGWVGKQPITLAIGEHPDEQEKEKKPDQTEKKPEPKPEPTPPKPNDPPSTTPAEGSSSKVTLVGEPRGIEAGPPPQIGAEGTVPATLANMPPSPAGPTPPDDLPPSKATPPTEPKLADLPSGPSDPLTLPGEGSLLPAEKPSTPPVTAAEPASLPEPMPGPGSTGGLPSMDQKPAELLEPPPAPAATTLEPPPPPPVEPPPAPAAAPPAIPEPSPTLTAPPKVEATAPVPAEKPPTLESVPATATVPPPSLAPAEAVVAGAATAGALGAGWVSIPSGGRRIVGTDPVASNAVDSPSPAVVRVADGPRASDALDADQVEPVLHRVRPGENFWTISKLYYRSGRYYRALHAANERQVPNIRELFVGTVLRIPPPEALDRSLIDPPGQGKTDDPAATTASRTSKHSNPAEEAELAAPVRVAPSPGRSRSRRGTPATDLHGQAVRDPPEHRPRHAQRPPARPRDLQPQPRRPRRPQRPARRDHPHPSRRCHRRPPGEVRLKGRPITAT